MKSKKPQRSTVLRSAVPVDELASRAEEWLIDGEIRQHSPRTLERRQELLAHFLWFLRREGFEVCGRSELRSFFAYLNHGHEDPEGRWGNPRCRQPLRPRTVATTDGHLRTLFRWLVREEALEESPMDALQRPKPSVDQPVPFGNSEVLALLRAADSSRNPKRNRAIVLMLVDCGLRASELCSLRRSDLNPQERTMSVLGKGNKRRQMPIGKHAFRALFAYLRDEPRSEDEPVFISERGRAAGHGLTRSGLLQLIERLGAAANVAHAHPHRFRHTFALSFLRNGANLFSLQVAMGHTDLTMTRRYTAIADADLAAQHRLASPGDRLLRQHK